MAKPRTIDTRELRKESVDTIVYTCLEKKEYIAMLSAPKMYKQNFVDLSLTMTGKMFYVLSVSTNCLENDLCKKHMAIPGAICNFCFAKDTVEHYQTLNENTQKNLEFFSSHLMKENEVEDIAMEIVETLIKNETHLLRLESFGDISNTIHCANYILLCAYVAIYAESRNWEVSIGWWTKNYHLFCESIRFVNPSFLPYFRKITNVILSSLFIGVEVPKAAVDKVENTLGMKVKVFTVYDIPENDKRVTCGARSCHFCKRCYTKKDFTEYVVEAKK